MSILLLIVWLSGFVYFIIILRFFLNLQNFVENNIDLSFKTSVTVVVPFRNEAKNIEALLNSLSEQTYPKELYNVILVNDHSTDNGKEIIENFSILKGELNIEIIELEEGINGKKTALNKAYQKAESDIILSTDADCTLNKKWIEISVMAFEEKEIQMLCGGVKIHNGKSWIEQFQSVELMSLIGSGAASIQMNLPIMSNGANLAFRKSILNEINFSNLNILTPSGDDVFLMMEVQNKFGAKAIGFEFNPMHWVKTNPMATFEELVQQRIRWTSKSKNYQNTFQIFVSLIVLLSNLGIPVLFIWSLFSLKIITSLLIYWLLKIFIDFIFIKKVAKISKQKFTLPMFLNTAIIYPFFISYIAIIGQFADFKWKDRNYKQK